MGAPARDREPPLCIPLPVVLDRWGHPSYLLRGRWERSCRAASKPLPPHPSLGTDRHRNARIATQASGWPIQAKRRRSTCSLYSTAEGNCLGWGRACSSKMNYWRKGRLPSREFASRASATRHTPSGQPLIQHEGVQRAARGTRVTHSGIWSCLRATIHSRWKHPFTILRAWCHQRGNGFPTEFTCEAGRSPSPKQPA